jgi:glutamyl-tRNA synthetase
MHNKVIVRFAPSPTGLLHVGNARTALLNYLFARKLGGKFLLRIDDTDFARSRQEFERAIYLDLTWLFGHNCPWISHQSTRSLEHSAVAENLMAKGFLYPCYESEVELERKRALLIARKKPPIYDRASLDPANREKWESEGRKPHWRFKLSRRKVAWTDLVRGPVEIDTATMSDPVLVREDGAFLYTLPSVVDDIDFAVSHVVRGEDHVTNTAAQIEIFEALEAKLPTFAHFPLLVGAGGEALSKRLGSLSLESLREDGMEAMAVTSYLAKLGTSDAIEPRLSLDELAGEFDFAKIGRAPAHFDPAELRKLNAKLLHSLSYDEVVGRLRGLGITGGAEFWDAVKPNIWTLRQTTIWWKIIKESEGLMPPDAALAAAAVALLPPEPWDETTWGIWTKAISQATGLKGRELFHPLRLALTFVEDGPELKKLLPLIGRARTLARLEGNTA